MEKQPSEVPFGVKRKIPKDKRLREMVKPPVLR